LLEARAIHTGRSARNHLLALAATNGIPKRRVDEVVGLVGLDSVASKRAGGFSLGMGQRLGIASALLGDPHTLILDEPVNGLDPEGILWIRTLMKRLAGEGRTVFVSSHLMSEMALTADHLIVIGKGELIADVGVQELVRGASSSAVRVRSPHAGRLGEVLAGPDVRVRSLGDELIEVHGVESEKIGDAAHVSGIVLHELAPRQASLEDAFMELTGESIEYRAGDGDPVGGATRGVAA
jgi:ABC-2 type transport system ATP-binding protein